MPISFRMCFPDGSRGQFFKAVQFLIIVTLSGAMPGCASLLSNGRGWGQDAFSDVSAKRMVRAAHDALFDVQTLFPAVAAAVLGPSGLGETWSDWATKHTPVFGSQKTADRVSDYLTWALRGEMLTTMLATPSGLDADAWWEAKARGIGVELLAVGATWGTTSLLKQVVDRSRPDNEDHHSFPSGHTSHAFSLSTLNNRNLDHLDLDPWLRTSLQVGNILTATGVAWARVEADKHFPSDVFASAALGHFLSAFIHDAFIGLPPSRGFRLMIWPSKSEAMLSLAFSF